MNYSVNKYINKYSEYIKEYPDKDILIHWSN